MKNQVIQMPSSLLYRLTDSNADNKLGCDTRYYIDQKTLYQDIQNNLEVILNTRSSRIHKNQYLAEAFNSVLNFGAPYFERQLYFIKENQQKLCQEVKAVIINFEPRLQNIKVSFMEAESSRDRVLMLRIEASINIKPEVQQAIFESNLDIFRYQFIFEGNENE